MYLLKRESDPSCITTPNSGGCTSELTKLGVNVRTATDGDEADSDGLVTEDGEAILRS